MLAGSKGLLPAHGPALHDTSTAPGYLCHEFALPDLSLTSNHPASSLPRPAPSPGSPKRPLSATYLYVSGFPAETTELAVYQAFAPFGALDSCKVKTYPHNGKCSGVAFVNFHDVASATRALEHLDGTLVNASGRRLNVRFQEPCGIRPTSAARMGPSNQAITTSCTTHVGAASGGGFGRAQRGRVDAAWPWAPAGVNVGSDRAQPESSSNEPSSQVLIKLFAAQAAYLSRLEGRPVAF